jgi:hypothetical protein
MQDPGIQSEDGRLVKYGRRFKPGFGHLEIELCAFRDGFTEESGGLGKYKHFINVVRHFWGKDSKRPFQWHPWAIRMAEISSEHKYVSLAGCGSSGKTDFCALWGIVNFICAPQDTLVLVTSTSLKDSRRRIWGAVCDYWRAVPGLPGKLVDSAGLIRFEYNGKVYSSDRCGISLLAGEKKKEREAIAKLIGMKNKRVFLLADELPELSEALITAAESNLALNPFFQLIASGNPNSLYDPHGLLSEPEEGWGSITVEDEEWRTKRGYCLHFDALKSPNWLAQEDIWPIVGVKQIREAQNTMDQNSLQFWRMFRGFWSPVGEETAIFAESDLIKFKAAETPIWGTENPTIVSALDPGFTNGGDRSAQWIAYYGRDRDGRMVVYFSELMILEEDVTNKSEPRNFQIARKFRENCERRGVTPFHAGVDTTAGGHVFIDIVRKIWHPDVLAVSFSGQPSENPVSMFGSETGRDRYENRVSELWGVAHEFLRNSQLKGVIPDLARELCGRHFSTVKHANGLRIQVEPKEDMKQRAQKSPDIADSAMIVIDLCRTRLGAIPGGEKGIRKIEAGAIDGQPPPQNFIHQKIQRFARIHAPRLRYGQDLASGRFR